jgi:hypothetical protein
MKSLCNLLILVPLTLSWAQAQVQSSYNDGTGEVGVPGGTYPQLDIVSVTVTASPATNQITFRIVLDGDPTAPDWGNYMIGLKSGSGGAVSGTGWSGRPINYPSGMTHWIGTWNTGGEIWTFAGSWTRTGNVTPVKDSATKSVTLTIPFGALALSSGETFTFDVYTSGGGGTDSAVDALSAPATSISQWNEAFSSTAPLQFTMPVDSDTDGDGLPDAWELANFNNLDQSATGDPDGDLLDNAAEFARSTNPTSADTDGDGLSDTVETNSGVYAGPAAPGTSPVDADTDNDGYKDGAEATGAALGFESNPLRKNFSVMAVPGNFNNWDQTGAAAPANAMTRAGTDLTAQYQFVLDYRFLSNGQALEYKFAGGSWSDNWGGSGGIAVPDGPNITATIAATGIHRFTFDQIGLSYTFTRPAFPSLAAFLAAYGLTGDPGGDADGDGLSNAAEYARNSDPGNPDTDGDGTLDNADPNPLGTAAPYDEWILTFGLAVPDQAREADPDGDGRSNLAEFLFGGNPTAGSDPAVNIVAAGSDLIIEWIGRTSPVDATYVVESNASLAGTWSVVNATPAAAPDQSGVAPGYTRFRVTVPRSSIPPWLHVRGTTD